MTLPIIAGAVVSLVQILGWNSITMLHDDADDDLGNYYFRHLILLKVNNRQLIRMHDLTELENRRKRVLLEIMRFGFMKTNSLSCVEVFLILTVCGCL